MSSYKRRKFSITFPEEAVEIIKQRMKALGFKSMTQYVNSVSGYDCWVESPHSISGEAVKAGGEDEIGMWREIKADQGKPDKSGTFFMHRVEEFSKKKKKKKGK